MRISGLSVNLKSFNVIHRTSNTYDKLLTQMSSGMKISKASQDPMLAQKSVYLHNLKNDNVQFKKNATDAKSLIDYTESIIGQAGDLLTRVKELAVRAATDTINNESREAIVKEVDQIILEITNMGNQQYNGKYLFSGTNTTTKPFEIVGDPPTAITYHGNGESVKVNISETSKIASNVPGNSVFLEALNNIITVRDDIKDGNIENITNNGFDLIEKSIDTLINARTELGAKSNIIETTISRIAAMDLELESSYSSLMGVNIAEKQIELASVEVSYQASLSVVSKLHSMSILNYLK